MSGAAADPGDATAPGTEEVTEDVIAQVDGTVQETEEGTAQPTAASQVMKTSTSRSNKLQNLD